ncbi:MAG: hypothetical protein ACK5DD_15770 [Cyclobacteriaceae bacterium]|jgi:hypothetical protein
MKKLSLLVLAVLCFGLAANAQEYKPFKVGIGLGYAMTTGDGAKGGVLLYLEPAYRVSDPLLVGLRLETAAVTRGFSEDVLQSGGTIDVAAIGSFAAFGQYYFSAGSFRPFVGAGAGLFTLAAVSGSSQGAVVTAVEASNKFGFFPRVGFDLGHFNMSVDFNLIPSSEVPGQSFDVKNSYLGFRAGFSIGGGKK